MKLIGIIAEYNPFHLGHAYQIQKIKDLYPDALIIVAMSGSFVQRGEPALFDKFLRTTWALQTGVHAVVELPTIFATANAERFAAGAVRLLSALGITTLAFGAETDNPSVLWNIAALSESDTVQQNCQRLLAQGLSYGTALRQAISLSSQQGLVNHPTLTKGAQTLNTTDAVNLELSNATLQQVLDGPNNILALEYIKGIQKYKLPLSILPILRESAHHSRILPASVSTRHSSRATSLPSGSALREAIKNAHDEAIKNAHNIDLNSMSRFFPPSIRTSVQESLRTQNYVDYKRYNDLVHYQSRLHTMESLVTLPDFTEGLERRWTKASEANSWPLALEQIKSKRYTYARLQRMGTYTVLGITKALQDEAHHIGPTYARLLGFTDMARPWLKAHTHTIPVVQKWGPFVQQSAKADLALTNTLLTLDMKATDIQALCNANIDLRGGHEDFYRSPLYIKV